MIEKQVNKLYETKRACDRHGSTQFQGWLLQENKRTTPDQELLIKQRYDQINAYFCGHIVDSRKL